MLAEIYPRDHARYEALPLLGPHLDGFVEWLLSKHYPRLPIRLRVRAAQQLDALLRQQGVRQLGDLSAEDLLAFAPMHSQDDVYRAALVHSLTRYLEEKAVLAPPRSTPTLELTASYGTYLESVRGLSIPTVKHHAATVRELLRHLGDDRLADRLRALNGRVIEGFLQAMAERLGRESLQHTVAHLRSFLRFLAARGLGPAGLDTRIDTPRVYRGERLPRSLSWETVLALLRAIDRSTPMGRRDYAMFLLVVTYGLRSCEVVSLRLDDIGWRDGRLRVPRPKVRAPLVLPLTPEVGGAVLAYLRDGRPALSHREVFLRVRAPAGTLKPTALTEAFQGWVRRAGLPIPFQGPHCLRHSLAIHLLRQGTPLKTIGDLLGHRSAESTCVYLRLHVEDLRDVALDLPAAECQEEVSP
jgi:integrase/recombinase XerD